MPEAVSTVVRIKESGLRTILISNQAGVGKGEMTLADLKDIEQHMQMELHAAGGKLDAAYYCLHKPDAGCECRKPKPGLLLQAQKEFGLRFDESIFIGDDPKDLAAGKAAGCPAVLIDSALSLSMAVDRHVFNKVLK